jgi:hypothetical protein
MTEEVFMDAVAAHAAADSKTNTQVIFKDAVVAAIVVAFTAGLYTASIAVGATPSQDVQYVSHLLNNLQYTARVTGTNLVVNW